MRKRKPRNQTAIGCFFAIVFVPFLLVILGVAVAIVLVRETDSSQVSQHVIATATGDWRTSIYKDTSFETREAQEISRRKTESTIRAMRTNVHTTATTTFNAYRIKNVVSEIHDDIEFREVNVDTSIVHIHFNITPWYLSSTERIAQQVMYKIICGLRQEYGTLSRGVGFAGYLRSTDDFGKKSTERYIDVLITKESVNRISCEDMDGWSDLTWTKVSNTYVISRLPEGKKPDYK